jgi:hypothetical protein
VGGGLALAFRFRRFLVVVEAGSPVVAGGFGGEVLEPETGKAEPLMSLAVERVTLRGGMNK